jgi:hypothetical protein
VSCCIRKICCCFYKAEIPAKPRLKTYPPIDRRIVLIKEDADRIRKEIVEDEKKHGHFRAASRII